MSRQSTLDGGDGGDDDSRGASISADGRYVAFSSEANNLSTDDVDGFEDVFVRDTQTDATILISRQSGVDGGDGGDLGGSDASISANGRYVAFTSGSTNLSGADGDSFVDVFLRDTQTNTTTLVSRQSAADGGAGGDGASREPSISADGRYVAFSSEATNLSADDEDGFEDIFVRDTLDNTTTLVSRQSSVDGGDGGDETSWEPSIAAEGRYVTFRSAADNLSTVDDDGFEDVFVRDTGADTTTLVSRQSSGDGGDGGDAASSYPSISADGRYVAFFSDADNLSAIDGDSFGDVFLRDTQTGTTALVSLQSVTDGGLAADSFSFQTAISADGRRVAFTSGADNLSTADITLEDVFVRDTQAGTTTLVSRQSAADGGAGGDGQSLSPAISADGRYVAFTSMADNLSTDDDDEYEDVFVRDLLSGPAPAPAPPAPLPPAQADTTAPGLGGSRARSPQALGKPLRVRVVSDEDAAVTVTAIATPRGGAEAKGSKRGPAVRFKPAKAQVRAGAAVTLRLNLAKGAMTKLKAAEKAKAKVTIAATDAAGNRATRRLLVKLR